jgi:hypothetical protein
VVVRWIDGERIEKVVDAGGEGLSVDDVVALKAAEQCLPGRLAYFEAFPLPRPWEPRGAPAGAGVESPPTPRPKTRRGPGLETRGRRHNERTTEVRMDTVLAGRDSGRSAR